MYALSIDQIADLLHFNGNNSYQTSVFIYFILLDHPFSMYAKLSEKLTFFISDDIHTYVRIRNVSFLEKFACVLKMDDPLQSLCIKGPFIHYVRKIFRKTNISNPLIRTHTCAYQGVTNVSFSENFACVLNK